MTTTKTQITEQSLALFIAYAKDAPNWSGTPLFNGNVCEQGEREDRGNLTQLKRAGLVTTNVDEGNVWISFTEKGVAFAHENGVLMWDYLTSADLAVALVAQAIGKLVTDTASAMRDLAAATRAAQRA